MARRKVDKPTHIYWLIDIRPEIIAAGWGSGQPFYCGKTDRNPRERLCEHERDAVTGRTKNIVGDRIRECVGHIQLKIMEIVKSRGGPSEDCREKARLARLGKPLSDEHKARMSEARRGKTLSPEHREKVGAFHRGRPKSDEQKAKMSASHKARWAARKQAKAAANG